MKHCYDLQQQCSLRLALSDLKGFWKLWSACLLQNASLPTLRGIIVTRRSAAVIETVYEFLKSVDARKALVRHDIIKEAPPYPRGGFLVPDRLVEEVLDFFFDLDRIVAIYEPADPLLNSYNLNILFETAVDVWVEVLGPGFDASDLQRGDLSPHERFSISISDDGKVSEQQRVSVVDEATYRESRKLRIRKIHKRFQESPTPELARRIFADLKFPSLEEYLKDLPSLLFKAETYVPISQALVTNTVDAILNSNVIELFRRETGVGFPLNFSTSFVDSGRRQVYWDIVSPKLKFQGLKQ